VLVTQNREMMRDQRMLDFDNTIHARQPTFQQKTQPSCEMSYAAESQWEIPVELSDFPAAAVFLGQELVGGGIVTGHRRSIPLELLTAAIRHVAEQYRFGERS
jgi:hypothetical protein